MSNLCCVNSRISFSNLLKEVQKLANKMSHGESETPTRQMLTYSGSRKLCIPQGECCMGVMLVKIPMAHATRIYRLLNRTVASSLEVVRPYCVVITTTPTSAHSLVQVPHKCGTAMAVPAL